MRRLLKEPLLHFLLLGAAIFVAYSFLSRSTGGETGKIVIRQGQLASMREGFILTWQRPPTREEWTGLIRDRIRQEVYYREALSLGLDKDDVIIQRRLQQKMEFVTDDIAARVLPTDDELKSYLEAHPDKFHLEQQFTFRQLYLNPKKHAENLAHDAEQLLNELNHANDEVDLAAMGDPFLLDNNFVAMSASEVTKQFGEKFTAKLSEISPGRWQGPVETGYGLHLVLVSERTQAHLPPLEDVREVVRREWENARRLETSEKQYETMLKRYLVTIERPKSIDKERD